jgi:hypothetical protein
MAIVGSLQSGLSGNHATLFAKAVLDGVFALVMATTLGVGVLFSAASVLVYQGALTLAAQAISGFLTQPMIDEMNCSGVAADHRDRAQSARCGQAQDRQLSPGTAAADSVSLVFLKPPCENYINSSLYLIRAAKSPTIQSRCRGVRRDRRLSL